MRYSAYLGITNDAACIFVRRNATREAAVFNCALCISYDTADYTVCTGGCTNDFKRCGTIGDLAFLVGDGNTGKSQLKSLVERLIGKGNFIGIDLGEIEARFGTGSIYGGASNSGKNYGNMTIRLGENISKTNVYACGSNSTMGKSFTVIADGVDLTKVNIRGRSATGDGVISSYMPDMTAPGAVKTGEVELVAGVALKNTLKAAVLKDIAISAA